LTEHRILVLWFPFNQKPIKYTITAANPPITNVSSPDKYHFLSTMFALIEPTRNRDKEVKIIEDINAVSLKKEKK